MPVLVKILKFLRVKNGSMILSRRFISPPLAAELEEVHAYCNKQRNTHQKIKEFALEDVLSDAHVDNQDNSKKNEKLKP